jgi:diguanylate cyclase (GGDEF)-like protein/PAS domain S-box-containing protein
MTAHPIFSRTRLSELHGDARQRLRLLESVVVHAHDAVIMLEAPPSLDVPPRIVYVNGSFTRVFGFTPEEAIGETTAILTCRQTDLAALEDLRRRVAGGESVVTDLVLCRNDGTPVGLEVSMAPVRDAGGHITHWISLHRDVSSARAAEVARLRAEAMEVANAELQREIARRTDVEEQLTFAAYHDALTGLPNRVLFVERVERALSRVRSGAEDKRVAVLFVDLDHFKRVNDTHGHSSGDALLRVAVARLQRSLRAGDLLARLGGDEFTVLLEGVRSIEEASAIARRVAQSLEEPFSIGGVEMFVTASVGIVDVHAEYESAGEVLRDADIAMYRAKERGRNGYELFHRALRERIVAATELDDALRRALRDEEFVLIYQPIVDLAEPSHPIGYEALVRWDCPGVGRLMPSSFIPAAEENGLIVKLGEWVLRTACRELRHGLGRPGAGRTPTISVNISAMQLAHPGFVATVARTLEEYGVGEGRLILEITESALMSDAEEAMRTVDALRAIGVRVHLDDFGTGFSSLNYLRRFSVDALKIDRSFVSGADGELADPEIVDTIVALGHRLGLAAIAEGVETEAQLTALRRFGCDAAQGALFGMGRDAAETRASAGESCAKGSRLALARAKPDSPYSARTGRRSGSGTPVHAAARRARIGFED